MQPNYLEDSYSKKEKFIKEGQPKVLLTGKYVKAISYANKHHKKQARKKIKRLKTIIKNINHAKLTFQTFFKHKYSFFFTKNN